MAVCSAVERVGPRRGKDEDDTRWVWGERVGGEGMEARRWRMVLLSAS